MRTAREIERIAWKIREEVLQVLHEAGSGHTASSLGLAEFFATMYMGGVLEYDVEKPYWEGRDRLIVSNGHVVPVWYVTLAKAGFFPKSELWSLREMGSRLQGHPHRNLNSKFQIPNNKLQITNDKQEARGLKEGGGQVPGVENTGGPLGQGVSMSVGMGLGVKMRERHYKFEVGKVPRTFCLMSDAELQEGQVWEAFSFAVMNKLEQLTFIIDRNNIEIDAKVDEVVQIEPLEAKLEAWGMYVLEVDGHDPEELREAFEKDLAVHGRPAVLIMNTVPGKGVSFMENDFSWHGKVPDESELEKALKEIREKGGL